MLFSHLRFQFQFLHPQPMKTLNLGRLVDCGAVYTGFSSGFVTCGAVYSGFSLL